MNAKIKVGDEMDKKKVFLKGGNRMKWAYSYPSAADKRQANTHSFAVYSK